MAAAANHCSLAVRAASGTRAALDGGSSCRLGECGQDSECVDVTRGSNGRCVESGPAPGYRCSYDACFSDSACGDGSVCQCRESEGSLSANYCTTRSNCRTDADCGPSGFCSPSQASEWCNTFYACHTPHDECFSDSDCSKGTACDYDANAWQWVCANLCGPAPP